MHRVVLILPDERKRLPRAKALRGAGFLVSTAMDEASGRGNGAQAKPPPEKKRLEADTMDRERSS